MMNRYPTPRLTSAPTLPSALLLATLVALAFAPGLSAQERTISPEALQIAEALEGAKRSHLWRIAIWGGANVALGVGLLAGGSRDETPTRFGFGVQSAAWGAINLGIAGVSFLGGPPEVPTTLSGAISAENGWADVLLVNLGLNVGYMGVGTALAIASGRGLSRGDEVRGHALGVIAQGAGLFIFDGIAWLASKGRYDALVDLARDTEVALVPLVATDAAGRLAQGIGVALRIPIG
jgi:hypothetical protein